MQDRERFCLDLANRDGKTAMELYFARYDVYAADLRKLAEKGLDGGGGSASGRNSFKAPVYARRL